MNQEKERIKEHDRILRSYITDNQYNYFVSRKSKVGYYFPIYKENNYEDCNVNDYLKFNDIVNEIVIEFQSILKNNFSEDYLTNFNKNLKTLGFYDERTSLLKKIVDFFRSGGAIAYYNTHNNELHVFDSIDSYEKFRHVVMHELLHMASTSNTFTCGLEQRIVNSKNKIVLFGEGLNEGCTEYLLSKYFEINESDVSYKEQVQMIKMIEKIVGKDLLEKSYFKNGMVPIINKLSEVSDEGLAIDTILSIDNTVFLSDDYINGHYFNEARDNISDIILSKLNKELHNGYIDSDTYYTSKFIDCDVYRYFNYSFTQGNTTLDVDGDTTYILDKDLKSLTCSPTKEYSDYVKSRKLTKYNY